MGVLLLLMALAATGCQTTKPRNDVLVRFQEWASLDPPSRLLAAREMPQEKASMVRWLEQYMRGQYHVIDERYVLTRPGFTNWAAIGSKAGQYMEQELGATYLEQQWDEKEWSEFDDYRIEYWRVDQATPRYFAIVMTREPLPGPDERKLFGYFELAVR